MAEPTKVRFFCRGTALVSDYDALDRDRPMRQMIGRRYGQVPGQPGQFGFMPTGKPHEVNLRHEVARDCAEGLLWPADKETAEACAQMMFGLAGKDRIKFDPKFGGEDVKTTATAGDDKQPAGDGQKGGA